MSKRFIFLLTAYFLSAIGDWFYKISLPLLIYELTGSAFNMAVAFALTNVPFVAFSLFGGVLADRFDKKKLLFYGDLISAFLTAFLAVLVALQVKSLSVIYFLVFLVAGIPPFYHPSFQSIIPDLVEKEELPRANARIHAAENMINIIGPLLGGGFVAALGAVNAFYLNALSFLLSAALIAFLPRQIHSQSSSQFGWQDLMKDLKESLSYVWRHPVLRAGSVFFVGTNFAINLFFANMVFFLTALLHLNASQVGLTFACSGMGAVCGSFVAARLNRFFSPGSLLIAGTMGSGALTLLLLLSQTVWAVSLVWAGVMLLSTVNIVTWFTYRQTIVPRALLGRVVAVTRMVAYVTIPLGAVAGGFLLNATQNVSLLILLSGGLRILVGIVALWSPLSTPNTGKIQWTASRTV